MTVEVSIISSERARNKFVAGLVGILGLSCIAAALFSDPAGLYKAWGITLDDMNEGVFDSVLSDEYVGKIVSDSQGYPDESERIAERNNAGDQGIIYNSDINSCVAINTGRWGYPETVDPNKPIIDTPLQAIELLPDVQTGRIYVRQGNEIKPFDSRDVFANGSCFFVGE